MKTQQETDSKFVNMFDDTVMLMFKQAILKPRLAGKKLDILEGPELPQ